MANTITNMTAEEYIVKEKAKYTDKGIKIKDFRTDTILCRDGILVSDTSGDYIRYDFIPLGIMREVIKKSLGDIKISLDNVTDNED